MSVLESHCPVCDATDPRPVFSLGSVPVICNQLWPDSATARSAPAGDVDLVICSHCAMIWNASFDPARMVYAPGYENALHFSPSFRQFADELAAALVLRYGLSGRDVVEIGCGDGHMLDLMVKHGAATATGFDPSVRELDASSKSRRGVKIISESFSSKHLDRSFDALLCRHVLEHIPEPKAFLSDIRSSIGARDVPIYFEVPNAGWMLQAVSMWDVIYEHITYWTAPSISTLLRRAGFVPVSIKTGYGSQFLMVEALPVKPESDWLPNEAETIMRLTSGFALSAEHEMEQWRERFSRFSERAVVWGAGSKGITFLNALGPASSACVALVDLNPRKQGLFAPGVGVPIIPPEALVDANPSLVLISNGLYAPEIMTQVRNLHLNPEFAVIAG